jgi:hypothetical protein
VNVKVGLTISDLMGRSGAGRLRLFRVDHRFFWRNVGGLHAHHAQVDGLLARSAERLAERSEMVRSASRRSLPIQTSRLQAGVGRVIVGLVRLSGIHR